MGFRTAHQIPDLGVGVGFRLPHYGRVLEDRPPMDWFEVISENFMGPGGRPLENLERLLETYRVVMHGVSLSIGASNPIDPDYVARLKRLIAIVRPPWLSDHLCWGGTASLHAHELLPLPQSMKVVHHVVERIKKLKDLLEIPFAVENVSSYMAFRESTMPEWDFLAEIAERADCGILLDCNNIYVSSKNHGFDPERYIDGVPHDRVVQIHLAGHSDKGAYLLDTHSDVVKDEVWALYERAIRKTGPVSTLIEWDDDIPEWEVLAAEATKARVARARALFLSALPVPVPVPVPVLALPRDDLGLLQDFVVHAIQRTTPLAEETPALVEKVTALATGNARMTPVAQLDVYREQFWLRHVGALAEDFRSIEVLLGDEAWKRLCEAYLARHPSTAFSLRDLGVNFAAFLQGTPPYDADPLLADLARLEWAFVDAWDAVDLPPLDPEKIARIPEDAWSGARLVLHPSVHVVAMRFPGHEFRAAARRDDSPSRPEPAGTVVVVYRGEDKLQYIDIERDAGALLVKLVGGAPLGPACETVVTELGLDPVAFEGAVGAYFQTWTQRGWIADVSV